MAYIRKNIEELTGYQEAAPLRPSIDHMCDFVMVYGTDETMPERVKQFMDAGYVVHLMTGIAWGEYQDYLDGKWDGRKHWDEGQKERGGKDVIHGPTVPYMVPTVSFSDYLTERLKAAVDCGVVAIHLEEPEFWDRSGYSDAFAREYEIRYHEPFVPQHVSVDANSKKYELNGSLNFSRISPDFEIQTVECTGNSRKHCFSFETNGKAITEVVEALTAMLPEIEVDYIFHSTDEDGVQYMHELCYEDGKLADESVTELEECDEEWF